MKASLCNTTLIPCIDLLRKKKAGQLKKEDVEALLNHEDYQFEFRRYEDRVKPQAFADYFLSFEKLEASQIQNMDLRNHHDFWLDLYENLDWFEEKTKRFFESFNLELILEAFQIAAAGFPTGYKFNDCKIVFTCGIGQSFGYANENGMHFDIMQLFRKYENEHFKDMIAHEIHHLIFLDNIVSMRGIWSPISCNGLPLRGWLSSSRGMPRVCCPGRFTQTSQKTGVWTKSLWSI